MGAQFDDPNREAVGLAPIWGGGTDDAPPEDEPEKARKAPKASAQPEPGPEAPKRDDDAGVT